MVFQRVFADLLLCDDILCRQSPRIQVEDFLFLRGERREAVDKHFIAVVVDDLQLLCYNLIERGLGEVELLLRLLLFLQRLRHLLACLLHFALEGVQLLLERLVLLGNRLLSALRILEACGCQSVLLLDGVALLAELTQLFLLLLRFALQEVEELVYLQQVRLRCSVRIALQLLQVADNRLHIFFAEEVAGTDREHEQEAQQQC